MSKSATFVRHTAKPGRRDDLWRVWEKYVRDYVAGSNGALSCYYCYDDNDPDTVIVFQLAADQAIAQEFVKQPWFADYQRENGRSAGWIRPNCARPRRRRDDLWSYAEENTARVCDPLQPSGYDAVAMSPLAQQDVPILMPIRTPNVCLPLRRPCWRCASVRLMRSMSAQMSELPNGRSAAWII